MKLLLPKVLHKMSSTEVPNLDPAQPSTPSSTTKLSPVSSVRKRARETGSETSDLEESGPGVDCDLEKENVAETEGTVWQKERPPCSALLKSTSVEFEPPQCKKRLRELSLLPCDSQTSLQPWSQDPLFSRSEYSEDFCSSDSSFRHSVENSEGFRNLIAVKGKTSTQKPAESCSHIKDDKENNRLVSCKSPSKRITLSHLGTLSNHKGMNNVSPQKQPDPSGNNLVKDAHFDSLWRKPKSSLKKQEKCLETDEDSFATLFTQDSEGFRVIAHRGLGTRSPLKDQSNLSTGLVRSCTNKSVGEEEEDDEMLFTQDSQGNVVIKH